MNQAISKSPSHIRKFEKQSRFTERFLEFTCLSAFASPLWDSATKLHCEWSRRHDTPPWLSGLDRNDLAPGIDQASATRGAMT